MEILDGGRISVAAMGVGLAQGAYDLAFAYAKERRAVRPADREVPGGAVRSSPTWRRRSRPGAQLVYRAAWLKDQGKRLRPRRGAGEALHRACSRTAPRTRRSQIHGGYGFMEEYAISRLYRDQKILEIGEGTNEVQRMVIAKLLGL